MGMQLEEWAQTWSFFSSFFLSPFVCGLKGTPKMGLFFPPFVCGFKGKPQLFFCFSPGPFVCGFKGTLFLFRAPFCLWL